MSNNQNNFQANGKAPSGQQFIVDGQLMSESQAAEYYQ